MNLTRAQQLGLLIVATAVLVAMLLRIFGS